MKKGILLLLFFVSALANAQIGTIKSLMYSAPNRYEIADMDNDGDLDVVCGNIDPSRRLYWYENVSPSVEDWVIHIIEVPDNFTSYGFTSYGDIKVADFNGDGWQDIFQLGSYTFLNNGNPQNLSFTPVEITDINPGSSGITGDIDNDGDIDLFRWTHSTGPNNFIYRNIDQDGTFGPAETINLPPPFTEAGIVDAHFFDLDQDNDLDIIASISTLNQPNAFVYWYENTDGQGTFEIAEIIYEQSYAEAGASYLAVGHFNNDNLPDIVSANKSGIYLHSQNATGWTTTLVDADYYSYPIEAYDFDNDGDLDIVEGRNVDQKPNWFRNTDNSGVFAKAPLLAPGTSFSYGKIKLESASDFDNDGDADLIGIIPDVSDYDGLFFFENDLNNSGFFRFPVKLSDNIDGYLTPLSFDIEQDGDQDVIVLSEIDREVYLLENINNNEVAYQQRLFPDEQITSIAHKDLDLDGDEDLLAINEDGELIWYENLSNGVIQFSEKKVLGFDNYSFGDIIASDIDEDGDIDISTISNANRELSIYEHITLDNFANHIIESDSILGISGIADIDQDGLKDILITKVADDLYYDIAYFKQNNIHDYSYIPFEIPASTKHVVLEDIDNDLDPDIIIRGFGLVDEIIIYFNENGLFDQYAIQTSSFFDLNYDLVIFDLDNDGKKDIYDGTNWYKQLPESSFSAGLSAGHHGSGDFLISDLNGDQFGDFIFSISKLDPLLYADNQIGNASIITGQVFWDMDMDCIQDTNIDTISFPDLVIEFERDGSTYYTNSNTAGYYAIVLPEGGDYTARINLPSAYWRSCIADSLINVPEDTSLVLNFPILAETECPLMVINMRSSQLRPCIDGNLNIGYSNQGTIDAENVEVEIIMDSNVMVDSASIPFVSTDTSLLFDIGTVGTLESGNMVLYVTPDCDTLEVGDPVCFSAYIRPDSLCLPLDNLWDGSTIAVSGECIEDSIHFELQNIGQGSMDIPRQFRVEIVNDDIVLLMQVDTFQLDPEETKTVSIEAEMDAVRLEAEQDENHPYLNTASTTVSECADFDVILNLIPDEDANPFFVSHCREITGSFDPNLKEAVPIGYGPQNLIDRSWELEYTIHFQNTGNDTAFNVVIIDPISEYLDLSSLRIGTASHPFNWELNIEKELIFNFEDILLPDSTTNLIKSQGYVQFFISPVDSVIFGTSIQNRAAIYFDFNEPIITDPVVRTIRTPVIASSEHFDICAEDFFGDVQIFRDTLIIDSMLTTEGLFLDFHHIHAEETTLTEIDTIVPYGTVFNDLEIVQDTIITVSELSLNGCDSLINYNISIITSTKEWEEKYGVKIAPIPTRDNLNISWESTPMKISLINTNGQTLLEKTPGQNTQSCVIDLGAFTSGVYNLKISFREGEINKYVIKL